MACAYTTPGRIALLMAVGLPLQGQQVRSDATLSTRETPVAVGASSFAPAAPFMRQNRQATTEPDDAVRMALASAVLPGTGQFLQGRRRWIVFLTIEAAAWAYHLDQRQDGRRLRSEYRDLAWAAARGGPEPRLDGDFEYYERVGAWARSGAYDAAPDEEPFAPERDPSTYNGAQWNLAAEVHLNGDRNAGPGQPGYDEAVDFYRRRAYADPFLWDWTGAPGEQQRFRGLIERSDDRLRTASVALAAVAANHLLSAVDAFAAARLGRVPRAQLSLQAAGQGAAPFLVLRIPLSRAIP